MKKTLIKLLVILMVAGSVNAQSTHNRLILVMDIQDHFTRKVLNPECSDTLIDNINHLLLSNSRDQIIYVQSFLRNINISFKGISVDTVPGMEFDNRLVILNDQVVHKTTPNAFKSDELKAWLEQHPVDEVILVGLMAEHCISHTAKGALKKKLQVNVVPEAIAGENPKIKEEALEELRAAGVGFIPYRELVFR